MLRRAWPVPVLALVVAAIVYAVWPLVPKRYESQATILTVPQHVPVEVVRPAETMSASRMIAVRQQVLSRTRLETIIREFRLYESLRARMPMEDVVEQMRRDIRFRVFPASGTDTGMGGFSVSVVSSDPKTSMQVADRLSSLAVNESLQDREVLAEATHDFLASQVDETRTKILENAKAGAVARAARKDDEAHVLALESEALAATYKSLLGHIADARVRAALERRQIGEQFKILERARIPEHPLGPTRTASTAVGGAVGAAVGLLLMAWLVSKRA